MAEKDIDIFVGNKIRLIRKLAGHGQKTIAEQLDVTFQQLQKYEKGINRIGPAKLLKLCSIFNVEITYFFEGWEGSQEILNEIKRVPKQRLSNDNVTEIAEAFSKLDKNEKSNLLRLLHELEKAS